MNFPSVLLTIQALPVIEIAPIQGFYDYKNKYKAGSAVETCPAESTGRDQQSEMQHYAERSRQRVLGLDSYSAARISY